MTTTEAQLRKEAEEYANENIGIGYVHGLITIPEQQALEMVKDIVKAAYLASAQAARKWIAITDKQPKDGQLVALRGNVGWGIFTACGYYSADAKGFREDAEGSFWKNEDVLGWYPLPEAP